MSSFNIRKIIRDRFGFLWVGTQDGLNRFDGSHFAVFNKGLAVNSLLGFDVRDLIELPDKDELIALTGTGGINVINTVTNSVTRSIAATYKDENVWNTGVVLAGNDLWLGTGNGVYIYDYASGKQLMSPTIPFYKRKVDDLFGVSRILQDEYHHVWCFVDDYGIAVFNTSDRKLLRKIDLSELGLSSQTQFNDVLALDDTTLLIGTDKGMRRVVFDQQGVVKDKSQGISPVLYSGEIYSVGMSGGSIYVGMNSGLYAWDNYLTSYIRYREEQDLLDENWLMSVKVLYLKDNIVWLGCKNGLAYSKMEAPVITSFFFDQATRQKLDDVFALLPLNNSELLVGLEHGLKIVNTATGVFRTIDTINTFYGLQRGPDNNILASTEKETLILHNDRLKPISKYYKEFSGIDHIQYNSLIDYGDSLAALGTESPNGLVIWNYRKHLVRIVSTGTEPQNISSNTVNSLYRDSISRLWVLSDNIISVYNDRFRRLTELKYQDKSGGSIPYYFCMCETKENYWICAYGAGILKVNKKDLHLEKIYAIKDGLCNNGVYKIFNYREQYLVVTSNNGMSMYDLKTERFYSFYKEDGLHGNNFEENVGAIYDSIVYAGGLHGVSRIRPAGFVVNTRPPVLFFSSIKVDRQSGTIDTSNLLMQEFAVPSDHLQTTIGFSALSYTNPSRVIFAYKVRELKGDWIQLGNQHFVNLIGLEPGTYTLFVKAMNEDGVWCEPVKLTLRFLPKWYQTIWFELLVFGLVASVFYLFYRYRIGQVRKQQQIRREIANDLHDDLGSTLTTVKLLAQIAKRSPEKEEHLDQIEGSLVIASTGLRDLIWVLDDARDSLKDFIERIKSFVLPITTAKGILLDLGINGDPDERMLSKAEKRNLLMIVKESVNNSIKYAECHTIRIQARSVDKKLSLTIGDDGKGFDSNGISEGNGLRNISYRAQQIHYSVKIVSHFGKGTVIELSQV